MGSLPHGLFLPLSYPSARRDTSVVDDYHGTLIPDPYRWLEDPEAEEVKAFVEEQADLTESVLDACPKRANLRWKMAEALDHPRYYPPAKRGSKCFFLHNAGLQAQCVLLVLDEARGEAAAAAEVLLDPNQLSKDGTVALGQYSISEDGEHLAYELRSSGSDWADIRVMRVEGREVLTESLSWVKFSSIAWTHDGEGFFYCRFPAPRKNGEIDAGTETNVNLNHELYYHFLGTDQSEDILCWRDPDHPKYIFEAQITEDGRYCLLNIEEGCDPANKLYYCDLSSLPQGLRGLKQDEALLPFTKLIDDFEGRFLYVSNDGAEFTFLTNKGAPRSKLVRVDIIRHPEVWADVLGESDNAVLEAACAVNSDQLVVCYMSDVKCSLQIRKLRTGELLHQLPVDVGTIHSICGRRRSSEFFFSFTSFFTPGIVFRCKLETGVPELLTFRESVVPGFDRSDFQVNQVFYSSKDGAKIPMFILCKKNTHLDGSNPALLYGYGGFNVSVTPSFSVHRLVLARHLGVISCIANIRGGGEYGDEWHKAGSLAKKQNCFNDFISAAEYLVSSGYTNPRKLCIEGRSNGGLLIAACINQRPDLYGCALAHVGVMDMLRFHKFTIGHAWTTDFGCSDKEEEFHWLIKYSPLHNVKRPWESKGAQALQYPPTMLLTADHDDRVVPLHTLKMLATMQYELCTSVEHSPQTNPIIARIDRKAGHGAGRSTQKMIDEAADRYGFMAKMLGATWIK